MNLAERGKKIRDIRKSRGFTQSDIADELGIAQQSIEKLENRHVENPRYFNALLKILGIDRDFLESDFANPSVADGIVPLSGNIEVYSQAENKENIVNPVTSSCMALRVDDSSMHPRIRANEIVFFDTSKKPERGRECVILYSNGSAIVREFEEIVGDILMARRLFPDNDREPLNMKDISSVYLVVARC